MVRYIGGFPVNPVQPGLLSDALIYRPEYGGTGLLNDGADFANVRSNFAGGMLDGFQINPVTGMPQTISPSGVFQSTGEGRNPNPQEEDSGGDGAFTIMDLMDFHTSMNQANFGNQDPVSAFQMFEDKGKGTFDIKAGSPYSNLLMGVNESGEPVPLNMAVDERGEKLSPQLVRNRIKASFSLIDESGGNDGGDGGDY